MCDFWASIMRQRDNRVILAAEAGMAKISIANRMGISHNTVYAILRKHREQKGTS